MQWATLLLLAAAGNDEEQTEVARLDISASNMHINTSTQATDATTVISLIGLANHNPATDTM